MRKFSSYGPIIKEEHYHVPRTELIDFAQQQLLGENFATGGHYITVWAPRQRGKSWVMQQVLWRLLEDERVDVLKLNLEHLKMSDDVGHILQVISNEFNEWLERPAIPIKKLDDFYLNFKQKHLKKPVVLILDEFDALHPEAISGIAGVFRNIYNARRDSPKPTADKPYLLHGVALIGVRAVLGVENMSGSPFNVQRSLQIPNLTFAEVESMFRWYERESGQSVTAEVIERLFYEVQGQPGLSSWFGELLTETFNQQPDQPLTLDYFEGVYAQALDVLPNNNILNIISKAKQDPYKQTVLELFRTDEPLPFKYDDPHTNFLYMNGVIDVERVSLSQNYIKFPCPFVQKRLFNYFANELFRYVGKLHAPFEDLSDTFPTPDTLNLRGLLRRYQHYLAENRHWLLDDAPRRKDMRLYEAVYHFNLYMFVTSFIRPHGESRVYPEFPTGNGQIDLIIIFQGRTYGLEIKSYVSHYEYQKALQQAARYGKQLGLSEISLAFFVEAIDEASRNKYETPYSHAETGVIVQPIFVTIGPAG